MYVIVKSKSNSMTIFSNIQLCSI